jgi:hypothetical protein
MSVVTTSQAAISPCKTAKCNTLRMSLYLLAATEELTGAEQWTPTSGLNPKVLPCSLQGCCHMSCPFSVQAATAGTSAFGRTHPTPTRLMLM